MFPTVSVILPTFNAAATLDKAILSVLDQTYGAVELVIVDGNSTDGTMNIIRQFGNRVHKVISEPDRGIYDAMNKGIAHSTGEWLYFLGADDELYQPGVLVEIFSGIDHQAYDVIYGDALFRHQQCRYDGLFDSYKLYTHNICHQALFTRRRVFEVVGHFDLRYRLLADHEFNIRWFNRSDIRRTYVPVVVALYNEKGASSQERDAAFFAIKDKLFKMHRYPVRMSVVLLGYARSEDQQQTLYQLIGPQAKYAHVMILTPSDADYRQVSLMGEQVNRELTILRIDPEGPHWLDKLLSESSEKYLAVVSANAGAVIDTLHEMLNYIEKKDGLVIVYRARWQKENFKDRWLDVGMFAGIEWKADMQSAVGRQVLMQYVNLRRSLEYRGLPVICKHALPKPGGQPAGAGGQWLTMLKALMLADWINAGENLAYLIEESAGEEPTPVRVKEELVRISTFLSFVSRTLSLKPPFYSRHVHLLVRLWLKINRQMSVPPAANRLIYRNLLQIDGQAKKTLLRIGLRDFPAVTKVVFSVLLPI